MLYNIDVRPPSEACRGVAWILPVDLLPEVLVSLVGLPLNNLEMPG
jgi:hypothetical protein